MYYKRLTARWTVADGVLKSCMRRRRGLGPDLQKKYLTTILRLKLRSTYDRRLIYKTPYKERKAFLRYDSLAKL